MELMRFLRKFSTSNEIFAKVQANNLKGRSKSSQEWLQRQLTDPYIEKAKMMNYRYLNFHVFK